MINYVINKADGSITELKAVPYFNWVKSFTNTEDILKNYEITQDEEEAKAKARKYLTIIKIMTIAMGLDQIELDTLLTCAQCAADGCLKQ